MSDSAKQSGGGFFFGSVTYDAIEPDLPATRGDDGVRDRGIDEATLLIEPGLVVLRFPRRDERSRRMLEVRLDRVVRPRRERLDLAIAGDDERQRGRLHAADREKRARAAALRAQRVRAAQVHADQPVRALPRSRGSAMPA